MTQLILDGPFLEPPTPAQWQQMREDYEDWLKEVAKDVSAEITTERPRKCSGACFCTGACQGYVSPGEDVLRQEARRLT